MRKLLLLGATASTIAAISACASGNTTVVYRPAPVVDPLRASIVSPFTGEAAFTLSRPAYVAVFDVVPGVGAMLIFPASPFQDRPLVAGYHRHVVGPLAA